jgi:hypothetical protein
MEAFAGACIGADADDCRLGDLSEQFVRTHHDLTQRLDGSLGSALAARLLAGAGYFATTVNVMLFDRSTDRGRRFREASMAFLIALDIRERLMGMIQYSLRRYGLPAFLLVCSALLLNGAMETWNSWTQTEALMVSAQRGKAAAISQKVTSFMNELERQIGWVAYAQFAKQPAEQRRLDYVRLLRQVPAITDLSQLDRDGHEQLNVTRLSVDVVDSNRDRSQEPAFVQLKGKRLYVGPLYFRKGNEPYLTMALSHGGYPGGATIAEVNLKLVWDAINQMKWDDGVSAYVIDGKGRLVSHRDVKLVVRQPDLTGQPQVAAALARDSGDLVEGRSLNPEGVATSRFSVSAPVAGLDWKVLVDVPAATYRAPLHAAIIRTAAMAGLGLVAAVLAIVLSLRAVPPVRPAQA